MDREGGGGALDDRLGDRGWSSREADRRGGPRDSGGYSREADRRGGV